ncbi:MAG: acyl-CoA thioesterase [Thermaerobacter sp.]|nr:acyl-CoA thioesterase [Thermaerobacter sp.]
MAEFAGKHVQDSRVEMTEIVMPNDANPLGTIFGGRVMQLMDIAASIAGFRHARCNVVTLSVDSLEFSRPIRVGDAVMLHAWLNWTGRTSMEVQVEVYSEDLITGERARTSTAYFTFVAVDPQGQPRQVPPLLPLTVDEERRYQQAAQRRAERLQRKEREEN